MKEARKITRHFYTRLASDRCLKEQYRHKHIMCSAYSLYLLRYSRILYYEPRLDDVFTSVTWSYVHIDFLDKLSTYV